MHTSKSTKALNVCYKLKCLNLNSHLFVVAVRNDIGKVASYITVTHYYDILLALILGCALSLCNNYVTCHIINDENSAQLKIGEFSKLCYFHQTLFAN